MAADSNMGFHHEVMPSPSSIHNRQMLSFQSGTMNSTSVMASGGVSSSGEMNGSAGMLISGNPGTVNNTSAMAQPGTSSSSTYLELRHDIVLTRDWTIEEQKILNEGLVKYANVHGVTKYIKIAAMLRRKTVRDVTWRCRWMAKNETAKRRKLEEYYAGKKMKDGKEKMVDSFSKANIHMPPPNNNASYYCMMHHANQNNWFSCEVPALDGTTQQLMDENARILSQISTNLEIFKIQENVDLFHHTRNNIATILNNMSNMNSIMSLMPPLPVLVNEELLNTILPITSQALMFGVPGGTHLEQQPRCDNLL